MAIMIRMMVVSDCGVVVMQMIMVVVMKVW